MNYAGFRIKLNGITVPNMLIARGSYTMQRAHRVSASYTDANGIDHIDYFPEHKTKITFSIKERNLAEQEEIKDIFSLFGDIPVIYWDDFSLIYREGIFHMEALDATHTNAFVDDINYAPTQVVLEEC